MALLNLDQAPDIEDPIRRLLWLSGVREQAQKELDAAWAETYAKARLSGLMPEALALGFHARKTAYRYTRAWNLAEGMVVKRWPDA